MIYLPDTNACIRYLNPVASPLARKMRATAAQDLALCDIVKMELYYGAYRSSRQTDNLALLSRFFSAFRSLLLTARRRTSVGASAANNLILVTHNTREFSRVAGLVLEDWEV